MTFVITIAVLTAVTTGIVQAIKTLGISSRFLPLVSIVVGFGLTLIATRFVLTPENIIGGIGVGLAAAGLFDFGKKTILGK